MGNMVAIRCSIKNIQSNGIEVMSRGKMTRVTCAKVGSPDPGAT